MALILAKNTTDFIIQNDLWYVNGKRKYYYRFDQESKEWLEVSKDGIESQEVVTPPNPTSPGSIKVTPKSHIQQFYKKMDNMKRVVNGIHRGLSPRPGYKSIFERGAWLSPIIDANHTPHPIFETLMVSLSGGRSDVKECLERMLLHKLYYPDDIRMPALIMWGQGETGKGRFYAMCTKIFADNVASNMDTDRFFGDLNKIIQGKAIVYINEIVMNKEETKRLKFQVTEEQTLTRGAYNDAQKDQNLVWWFVSHNYEKGNTNKGFPIQLDGDSLNGVRGGADRRWFVIEHKPGKTFNYWIENSPDYRRYLEIENDLIKTLNDYRNIKANLLEDDVAIMHWLGSLVLKYGEPEENSNLPWDKFESTIWGDDYQRACSLDTIVNNNELSPQDNLWNAVFDSDEFEKVYTGALYRYFVSKGNTLQFKSSAGFGKSLKAWMVEQKFTETWNYNEDNYWYRKNVGERTGKNKRDTIDESNEGVILFPSARSLDEVVSEFNVSKLAALPEVSTTENFFEWYDACCDDEGNTKTPQERFDMFDTKSRGRSIRYRELKSEIQTKQMLDDATKFSTGAKYTDNTYIRVMQMLDDGDFKELVDYLYENYRASFRKVNINPVALCEQQIKFREKFNPDAIAGLKKQFKDLFNAKECIRWLETREDEETVRFIKEVLTKTDPSLVS